MAVKTKKKKKRGRKDVFYNSFSSVSFHPTHGSLIIDCQNKFRPYIFFALFFFLFIRGTEWRNELTDGSKTDKVLVHLPLFVAPVYRKE